MDLDGPNRNLKRVEITVGVSARIQKLALKKRGSLKIESKEERNEKILKAAKEQRSGRNLQIGLNERYLLEVLAHFFGRDEKIFYDCAADTPENIDALSNLFIPGGTKMILIQLQLDDAPAKESGRYDPKLKFEKVETVLFTNGKVNKKIRGQSIVAYRLKNSHVIDPKSVAEEVFFATLPEDGSMISSIFNSLSKTVRPALELSKDYGYCPESRKQDFIYGVDLFLGFLKSTRSDIITCNINFEVDNNLFKGFLLAPHQIKESSKLRDKVADVEKSFTTWVKQIKSVVAQGRHLTRDGPDVGPLVELQHWRYMLTKFNYVIEFTDSRAFQNYLKCLKLSRSKMIAHWKETEDCLIILLNEARDNVRFMTSIEKFWDPLYRCEPLEIVESLPILHQAIRSVYNSSSFYNTNVRMSGIFSKVVNQLIIASKKYLTSRGTSSIWTENKVKLVKKIEECKKLKIAMRGCYQKMLCDMVDNGEVPFDCSDKYLFEKLDLFEKRLNKISDIIQILMQYHVLDRIKIVGTEYFANQIKLAYKIISEKSSDPLMYRDEVFEKDYIIFKTEISSAEIGLKSFVKRYLEQIQTSEMRLLTLKRFAMLNLDCLCLDHRYLDVAVMLEKEIEDIKDKYNEERASPPIGRDIPPVVGRIRWARALLKKMEEPLKTLEKHDCVITHPKTQLSVKFYNYLAGILFHYETMQHKAWFSYADMVRSKLESPLIRKDPETNQYYVNLDRNVLQIIKETQGMWKLGLEVPETAKVLTYCKDQVTYAFNMTEALINRNNQLRRSIYPIFTPMMRIQVIKLERIFAPAISTMTWLSQNLDEYFQKVIDILQPIESFIHEISDINDKIIESAMKSIEETLLINLPEGAETPQHFLEMNVENRQKMEKKIAMKSLVAERAAIDLINKFVDKSGVAICDDSGKFQFPPDKITESNWRVEEFKPIDKYDWLSYGKLYKAVGYATPEENEKLVFEEHDGLKYDVVMLHIDCVELFAYYNHKIVAALAKCTKRSMEILKQRSNVSALVKIFSCEDDEKPLLKASIELKIPDFKLVPKMPEIQKFYEGTLMNIIETHYGISTWGKEAKTEERRKRKPLIDEIRHEKHFFKTISEHKEVMRYKLSFDNGVLQLESKINSILDDLRDEYSYLWSTDRDEQLETFVQSKPLIPDIRDRLKYLDGIIEDIAKLDPIICVRTIEVDRTKMINALIEEAKAWKSILGSKLSDFYKEILDDSVSFIQNQQKKLERNLADLDDCRITMTCLRTIRENYFRIDENLHILEETYATFAAFHLNISVEDSDRVDGLRYNFNNMINSADTVNLKLLKLQVPLLKQLEEGIEKFVEDLATFNENFVKVGPMIQGIAAKEATDRNILYDVILQELARRNETFSDGQLLFGLDVTEFPLIQKRKDEIAFLHQFFKLHGNVVRCIKNYSDTLVSEVNVNNMEMELQEFAEVHKAFEIPKDLENWANLEKLRAKIEKFIKLCPALILLTNSALKDDHWKVLEAEMSYGFAYNSGNFTLRIIIEAPLMDFEQIIGDIYVQALKDQENERKPKKFAMEEVQENVLK